MLLSKLRLPELDGLRAFAILQVVAFHFFDSRRSADSILFPIIAASRFGWSGVDLFFVLSGFLISGIVLDNRDSPNLFRTFYARRAFRILPMYATLLVLGSYFGWIILHPLWVYLTFTQNVAYTDGVTERYLDVTWSLAVEEQMYLLLPVTIYFSNRRVLAAGAFGLVVLTPIARALCSNLDPWIFALTPLRLDSFAIGLLIALAWRDPSLWSWISSRRTGLTPAMVVLLVCAVEAQRLDAKWAAISFFALAYGAALMTVLAYRPKFLRGPLAVVGISAYSMYLFHEPIMDLVARVVGGGPLGIALPIGSAVVVGVLAYYLIERRLIGFAASQFKYRSRVGQDAGNIVRGT